MERCYWTVVLKYVFDAARYHGGAADRSSLLGCDAVLLWKYFWMFWMVTVPTCSESSSPIRIGCVTVKMKALWPFEMMRTPDWHSTTWIVSCSTEETSNLVVWQMFLNKMLSSFCHINSFIAIAAAVSVWCAVQFTCRYTDHVISCMGYRIFFSTLHPGEIFCLHYIINKFVLPVLIFKFVACSLCCTEYLCSNYISIAWYCCCFGIMDWMWNEEMSVRWQHSTCCGSHQYFCCSLWCPLSVQYVQNYEY